MTGEKWKSAAMLVLGMAALLVGTPAAAEPSTQCTVSERSIGELSGLVADKDHLYAINDGGTKLNVFVLNRSTCKLEKSITNKADPYDVEDLARTPDGAFWLADIGDNNKNRETVALTKLSPDGKTATLYRLTYPDGAHDAEALLIDRKGVPYIVTKVPLGAAGVYRPDGPLQSSGPTKLTQVGSVDLQTTETPGGPTRIPHSIASVLVTGGAVAADGTVIALRTYTDAYLYSAPDGDVLAALGRTPVQVPLPNEPQGEAIAFDPDGNLLSGSEGAGQPIHLVTGATSMVNPKPQGSGGTGTSGTGGAKGTGALGVSQPGAFPLWPVLGAIVVIIILACVLYVFLSRRQRRR
ncbi:hypothetical protein [Actinocrispum sp. NPDC049592]|uniref:hypothetical protein n=1 Tax=Actinocrispum sp. NPDC049592 TaxID=3154835 RepID=UPI00342058A6